MMRAASVAGSLVLCLSSAQMISASSPPEIDAASATPPRGATVVGRTAPRLVPTEEDFPNAVLEVDAGPDELRNRPERGPTPAVEPTAEPSLPPADVVAPSTLVALPLLAADVWSAEERYFPISGGTPDELIASAKASVPADAHGIDRESMAYAGPTVWQHQP